MSSEKHRRLFNTCQRPDPMTSLISQKTISNCSTRLSRPPRTYHPPPLRALFKAYDQILATHNISKNNDRVYLRFLMRMGEGRRDGSGLFEQFKSLLDKLGFDVDREDLADINEAFHNDSHENEQSTRLDAVQTRPFRPTRRATFDTSFDTSHKSEQSLTQLPLIPVRARSTDGNPLKSKSALKSTSILHNGSHFPSIPKQDLAPRNSGSGSKLRTVSESSGNSYKRQDIDQRENAVVDPTINSKETNSSGSDVEPSSAKEKQRSHPNLPLFRQQQSVQLQHSNEELERQARVLKYHHVAARSIGFFRLWLSRARQRLESKDDQYRTADSRDKKLLMRQALDQWLLAFYQRKYEQETKTFFKKLEDRAEKARDLLLLTKAFTHWAQCASEEVLRKTTERQHILRVKYFNAWRDITVVNELKIRRYRLSKFFSLWKNRAVSILDYEEQADEMNESRLIDWAYHKWFWHFCDRRAPVWHNLKLRDNLLRKWIHFSQNVQTMSIWAADFRDSELMQKTLLSWTQKSEYVADSHQEALRFRHRTLLASNVEVLRRELEFQPRELRISSLINTRLLISTLDIWKRKTKDEMNAKRLNDSRTMNNCWKLWNDKLRCQFLQRSINDRLLTECLYRLILAERLRLFQRVQRERLRKSIFKRWQDKTDESCVHLGHSQYLARRAKEHRSVRSILSRWATRTRSCLKAQEQAFHLRQNQTRSIMKASLDVWISRNNHVSFLKECGYEGRKYILIHRYLDIWRVFTEQKRKEKRREIYWDFRNMIKDKVKQGCLEQWRNNWRLMVEMSEQADEMYTKRIVGIRGETFDLWKSLTLDYERQRVQAEAIYQEQTIRKSMQILMSKSRHIQTTQIQAQAFSTEGVRERVTISLRRMSWRLFQLKQQEESATSLAERNERKHFRNMIRYWVEKTSYRQNQVRKHYREPSKEDEVQEQRATTTVQPEHTTPLKPRSPPLKTSRLPISAAVTGTGIGVSTPGYLRTPLRTRRQLFIQDKKIYSHTLSQPQFQQDQPQEPNAPIPTTPASTFRRDGSTSRITPFTDRLRAYGVSSRPSYSFTKGVLRERGAGNLFGQSIRDGNTIVGDTIPETSPVNPVQETEKTVDEDGDGDGESGFARE